MDKINVTLDDYTTINVVLKAISKPYRNGKPTLELLKNIVSYGHTSVLEHIVFHFDIANVSRLLLQEFSRHWHRNNCNVLYVAGNANSAKMPAANAYLDNIAWIYDSTATPVLWQ